MKEPLFGKTLDELKTVCETLDLPGYTAKQMADWMYRKNISSIGDMTNLSKDARSRLEESFSLGRTPPKKVSVSSDGTKKYLFSTTAVKGVETAYIPDGKRHTVCLSTQVGCKMGCRFCMTGQQGFQGNLTSGEILNQLRSIDEWDQITNIVYMGMGEPLDNYEEVIKSLKILTSDWGFAISPRRITVSTIGIIPAIKKFLEESEAHLAISLHSPFDEERQMLMPVQKSNPIDEVLKEIRSWNFGRQRRVSFEYIMFKGLNDTPHHVNELSRILKGIRCRINLIRFHAIPESPFQTSEPVIIQFFKDSLNKRGVLTTIRESRGEDIEAACGMLSTKNN